MKRLFIISWITLLFISCGDDFLTKFPDDAVVTENAITTIAETQTAVNGLYALMASQYYYAASLYFYGEVKGRRYAMPVHFRKNTLHHVYFRPINPIDRERRALGTSVVHDS